MPILSGNSSTEVDVAIDQCWALVENVAIAPEWQHGLERMDVLERDEHGRALIAITTSNAKIRKVESKVRFTYEAPTKLSWIQIEKGALESMQGYWELGDLGDGRTRVTYAVEVDPGRVGMLARGPLESVIRALLVGGRAKELARRVAAAR